MSIKFNYIAIVNYMLEVSLVIHTLAPIIPEFTQNQKQFLIFSQPFSNLIFSVIWLVLFHVLMFHQRIEIINQDNTWTRSGHDILFAGSSMSAPLLPSPSPVSVPSWWPSTNILCQSPVWSGGWGTGYKLSGISSTQQ